MSTDNKPRTLTLDAEETGWLREAIVIGLTCYGQIEEILNTKDVLESTGQKWPDYLDVRHPTGSSDVVSKFATALTLLSQG